jgi:hypothetical protein
MKMNLESFGKSINTNTWIIAVITFMLGLLFGPGLLWQYKNISISKEKLFIEKTKLECEIRKQLLELQNEIINKSKNYIDVRDRYLREKGSEKQNYELQNQYEGIKSTMVKLISNYNVLEAKLPTLEG